MCVEIFSRWRRLCVEITNIPTFDGRCVPRKLLQSITNFIYKFPAMPLASPPPSTFATTEDSTQRVRHRERGLLITRGLIGCGYVCSRSSNATYHALFSLYYSFFLFLLAESARYVHFHLDSLFFEQLQTRQESIGSASQTNYFPITMQLVSPMVPVFSNRTWKIKHEDY